MTDTTARGYVFPQNTDHDRLWEHFEDLAESIDADVELVDRKGIVAWVARTTPTGLFTTTETGVVRIDNIPVYAGRAYEIATSGANLDTTVDNDVAAARIRISTSGAATTASTQIGQMRNTADNNFYSNVIPMQCFYFPGSDQTLSVLLSAVRLSGSGNISFFCSGVEILHLVVRDIGPAPAASGVVL